VTTRRGPATPVVAALDVGTSSVRALLYDGLSSPVAGAEVLLPYRPRVGVDGTAAVDPGRHVVAWQVVAGLAGNSSATAHGTFTVAISAAPAQSYVSGSGQIVTIP